MADESNVVRPPYISDDDLKIMVWYIFMNMQELLKLVQEDKLESVSPKVQKD